MSPEPFFISAGLIAFFLVYSYLSRTEKQKLPLRFFTILLLSAYLGARIVYLIQKKQPFSIGNGIVSWGFIIGGFIGILIYFQLFNKDKNSPVNIAKEADKILTASALTFAITRIGCFLDGHLLGTPTALPWGVFKYGALRHPIGIYLSLSALLIFMILFNRYPHKKYHGEVALWFLLIYCFNRFWIEFMAVGHLAPGIDPRYSGLLLIQWICLITIIIAAHELIKDYSLIKRLKLNSVEKYSEFLNNHSWLKQQKIFYRKT
ncbi:MAG: prolipoprotein diacylglyceryl transferase [Nanoarchaeota archaeon]|nr:prolipoprotein diacylglyceryl transferase [Nanoarchaeota archaeon]